MTIPQLPTLIMLVNSFALAFFVTAVVLVSTFYFCFFFFFFLFFFEMSIHCLVFSFFYLLLSISATTCKHCSTERNYLNSFLFYFTSLSLLSLIKNILYITCQILHICLLFYFFYFFFPLFLHFFCTFFFTQNKQQTTKQSNNKTIQQTLNRHSHVTLYSVIYY